MATEARRGSKPKKGTKPVKREAEHHQEPGPASDPVRATAEPETAAVGGSILGQVQQAMDKLFALRSSDPFEIRLGELESKLEPQLEALLTSGDPKSVYKAANVISRYRGLHARREADALEYGRKLAEVLSSVHIAGLQAAVAQPATGNATPLTPDQLFKLAEQGHA